MMRALSAPPWSRPFGTDTPVAWRQDAALRRSVLIETDADGRFRDASGLTWCYDLERGWARI
jgi:hypothetical protein